MVFQESETVELKTMVVEDIKKEIIAFANCKGGKLYIGVRDDGSVCGLDDPDEAALQVSNMVRDGIKPDLTMFLHYETVTVDEKKIVAVDIQQGTERPYYIARKGLRPEGVYLRQGYSAVPATNTAIRRMIKETDGDHFEEMRSLEQRLTFEAAKKIFARQKVKFGPAQMKTLGLARQDGVYTNLGLLLSDQCVHTVKAAVFQGMGQSGFQDRKEFSGSLFSQMEQAYNFIDLHNQTRSTYDGLYRIDRRDYPQAAVREALLNLLVHREYAFRASSFISLYADRIEFTSIGGLAGGVSLRDVTMGISVCRNAGLANVFYRLELIEAYGTGIAKMMEAYEGSGAKPQIETSDNAFKVTLPNLNAVPVPAGQTAGPIQAEQKSGGAEEKVTALIRQRGPVTRREIELLLGVGQSTCGRLLRRMTGDGALIREGKGRNTRYRLPR